MAYILSRLSLRFEHFSFFFGKMKYGISQKSIFCAEIKFVGFFFAILLAKFIIYFQEEAVNCMKN